MFPALSAGGPAKLGQQERPNKRTRTLSRIREFVAGHYPGGPVRMGEHERDRHLVSFGIFVRQGVGVGVALGVVVVHEGHGVQAVDQAPLGAPVDQPLQFVVAAENVAQRLAVVEFHESSKG